MAACQKPPYGESNRRNAEEDAVGLPHPSPRGCQGDFTSIGTAQVDRIEATFNGSDCVLSAGPVLFTGAVSLTKAR
jgi:hypothetical protein